MTRHCFHSGPFMLRAHEDEWCADREPPVTAEGSNEEVLVKMFKPGENIHDGYIHTPECTVVILKDDKPLTPDSVDFFVIQALKGQGK